MAPWRTQYTAFAWSAMSSMGIWKASRSSKLTSAQTMVLRREQVKQLLRPEQVWVRLILAIGSDLGAKTRRSIAVVMEVRSGIAGLSSTLQAQGVDDDRGRTHGHGGCGDHRVEPAGSSDRDGDDVVAERPEQILPDDRHGAA